VAGSLIVALLAVGRHFNCNRPGVPPVSIPMSILVVWNLLLPSSGRRSLGTGFSFGKGVSPTVQFETLVFTQGLYRGLRIERWSIMGSVLKRFLAEVTGGSFVMLRQIVTHSLNWI
jgi:hypothetical protein